MVLKCFDIQGQTCIKASFHPPLIFTRTCAVPGHPHFNRTKYKSSPPWIATCICPDVVYAEFMTITGDKWVSKRQDRGSQSTPPPLDRGLPSQLFSIRLGTRHSFCLILNTGVSDSIAGGFISHVAPRDFNQRSSAVRAATSISPRVSIRLDKWFPFFFRNDSIWLTARRTEECHYQAAFMPGWMVFHIHAHCELCLWPKHAGLTLHSSGAVSILWTAHTGQETAEWMLPRSLQRICGHGSFFTHPWMSMCVAAGSPPHIGRAGGQGWVGFWVEPPMEAYCNSCQGTSSCSKQHFQIWRLSGWNPRLSKEESHQSPAARKQEAHLYCIYCVGRGGAEHSVRMVADIRKTFGCFYLPLWVLYVDFIPLILTM